MTAGWAIKVPADLVALQATIDGEILDRISGDDDLQTQIDDLGAGLTLAPALAAIAPLTPADGTFPFYTSPTTASLSTITTQGRAILDDTSFAAMRTTLGLGTIATQNANAVAVTGGNATGLTALVSVGADFDKQRSGDTPNLTASVEGGVTGGYFMNMTAGSPNVSLFAGTWTPAIFGKKVRGPGIPPDTYLWYLTATTALMSNNATATHAPAVVTTGFPDVTDYANLATDSYVGHISYAPSGYDSITAHDATARFTYVEHFIDGDIVGNTPTGTIIPGPRGMDQWEGTIVVGPNHALKDATSGPWHNNQMIYKNAEGADVDTGGFLVGSITSAEFFNAVDTVHSISEISSHWSNTSMIGIGGGAGSGIGGTLQVGQMYGFIAADGLNKQTTGVFGDADDAFLGRYTGYAAFDPRNTGSATLKRAIGVDIGRWVLRSISAVSSISGNDILTIDAGNATRFTPEDVGAQVRPFGLSGSNVSLAFVKEYIDPLTIRLSMPVAATGSGTLLLSPGTLLPFTAAEVGIGLRNAATTVNTASAVQIVSASVPILCNATTVQINSGSGSVVTLPNPPIEVANLAPWMEFTVFHVGGVLTNDIVLPDAGATVGGMRGGLTIRPGGMARLIYNGTQWVLKNANIVTSTPRDFLVGADLIVEGDLAVTGGEIALSQSTFGRLVFGTAFVGTAIQTMSMFKNDTDTEPILEVLGVSGVPTLNMGAGGIAATDLKLHRSAASTLKVDSAVTVAGLTGATAASRYVGGVTTGVPVTGTFVVGDEVIAQDGTVAICTVAGSPGTWERLPNLTITNALYQPLDTDLSAIAALIDPNADRILFWDDSAGAYKHLTIGTGLAITGTTLDATGGTALTQEQVEDFVGAMTTDSGTIDFTYTDAAGPPGTIDAVVKANSITTAMLNSATLTDITEQAQDAVGAMIADTATIDLAYVDATPQLTATVIDASITNTKLATMADGTIKGRALGAGTGVATDLTPSQVRTLAALVIGTDVQAWDTELDTWATKTAPSSVVVGTTDVQTLTQKTLTAPVVNSPTGIVKADVGLSNVADLSAAGLAADTAFTSAYQPLDTDLTAFAAKTAPAGAVVGTTDTQTLTNKTLTSPAVTTPTGIVKGDVGLGNVDNTTDAGKPVSTAQQTALDLKAPLASPTFTGTVTSPDLTLTGGDFTLGDGTAAHGKIDFLLSNVGVNVGAFYIFNDTGTTPVAKVENINGAGTFALGPGASAATDVSLTRTGAAAATLTGQMTFATGITMASAKNIATNTGTGTIIAVTTSQKLGLWGAAPVIQPASANQAAVGTTAPAGGTGATAGAYDTAANRNTMITTVNSLVTLANEIRTALVNVGIMKGAA